MPELPEVETIVRDLRQSGIAGRTIVGASIHWHRTLAEPAADQFVQRIAGKRILNVTRRAKYIVINLTADLTLLVHLRMTGRLYFAPKDFPLDPYERAVLHLDGGQDLRFRDTRKFGRWYFLEDTTPVFSRLGPEPLAEDFSAALFAARLAKHNRQIKPLLLDQSVIAGLGNIYADEALWLAKVHPTRLSGSLTVRQVFHLYEAIVKVLTGGIEKRGTSLGETSVNYSSVTGSYGENQDWLKVFQRTGEPCARCGTKIKRLVVAQRSSHICPKCQRN